MKPSWVLSPDERERRFRKNKEKKLLQDKDEKSDKNACDTKYLKEKLMTTAMAVDNGDTKPEISAEASRAVSKHVLVKSEAQTYPQDPKVELSRISPPVIVNKASMSVEPKTSEQIFVKEILPMKGLTSPVQQQNFYVYSSPSHQFVGTTPIISTREGGISSIVIQRSQFSENSSHGYPIASTSASNNLEHLRSPGVIVKSQNAVERSRGQSSSPLHIQQFSPRIKTETISPWHTPVSLRDTQSDGPMIATKFSNAVSPMMSPQIIKSEHPMVMGRNIDSNLSNVSLSPSLRRRSRSSPKNEMSDESEYEESVYYGSSDDERSIHGLINEPEIKFTDEEHEQLKDLVRSHDERYRSVNFGEELIKEMIMCSMFGIPISASAAISGYRLTVERITRIANNLNCFVDLPIMDQSRLLKENADLLVSLRGAIFFDSRKKGVNQVLISMGIDDLDTIKTMFTPLMKESKMKHIDYKIFNSIQKVESDNSVEQRYNSLQSTVADSIRDDITTILLTYIILFSVDFCTLQDRRRVEQLQEQFIRMLERYVYSQTSRADACHILAKSLNAVTCIREMADIKKSRAINQAVKLN